MICAFYKLLDVAHLPEILLFDTVFLQNHSIKQIFKLSMGADALSERTCKFLNF